MKTQRQQQHLVLQKCYLTVFKEMKVAKEKNLEEFISCQDKEVKQTSVYAEILENKIVVRYER